MKKLTQFQCEICNIVYDSEVECKECEAIHTRSDFITNCKFNNYMYSGAYPQYMAMKDDETIRFKRQYSDLQ